MKEIGIKASRDYRVLIEKGLLGRAGELSAPLIPGRRALIAAGETVAGLYGDRLRESLENAGFEVFSCVYPSGGESQDAGQFGLHNQRSRGERFLPR